MLTGVYQTGPVAHHALAADVPVATFGTLRKTLNIGYGRQLEAQLITAVTVADPHRRQRAAAPHDDRGPRRSRRQDGLAMAALTASEASIYGRFGFGVATFERSDQGGHRPAVPAATTRRRARGDRRSGRCCWSWLRWCSNASTASRRAPSCRQERVPAAQLGNPRPGRRGGPKRSRCALHYGPDGDVDGYVAYKFAGWDTKPYTMEVVDLVAATEAGYLELWQFLGSHRPGRARHLGRSARGRPAAVGAGGSALHRRPSTRRDMLWLRILDVAKALGARRYSADGALVLRVTDTLGFAAGTFTLDVSGGEATVTLAPDGDPGPVPRRRGPRVDLSRRRLPGDAGRRRADHRTRARGGADSAAHVRRRTRTALPDALLAGPPPAPLHRPVRFDPRSPKRLD